MGPGYVGDDARTCDPRPPPRRHRARFPPRAATLAAEPDPWLTALSFPVNIAWAPDGTLFYAEKELGDVRMVVDGAVVPAVVAHVDVEVSFETGLLGLAVDPAWPDEPWLYLYARTRLKGSTG